MIQFSRLSITNTTELILGISLILLLAIQVPVIGMNFKPASATSPIISDDFSRVGIAPWFAVQCPSCGTGSATIESGELSVDTTSPLYDELAVQTFSPINDLDLKLQAKIISNVNTNFGVDLGTYSSLSDFQTDGPNVPGFLTFWYDGALKEWRLDVHKNGPFTLRLSFPTSSIPAGSFVNIEIVKTGSMWKFFADGLPIFDQDMGTAPTPVNYLALRSGVGVGGPGTDTHFDNVVLSNSQSHLATFTESGLPPNTSWSMTLFGITHTSTTNTITFTMPDGSYSYNTDFSINACSGSTSGIAYIFTASPYSGSLIINGQDVSVRILYSYTNPNLRWAGYVVSSSICDPQKSVTMVEGSWVVPTLTSDSLASGSTQWAGLGGLLPSDDFAQAGTTSLYSAGIQYNYVWFNLYQSRSNIGLAPLSLACLVSVPAQAFGIVTGVPVSLIPGLGLSGCVTNQIPILCPNPSGPLKGQPPVKPCPVSAGDKIDVKITYANYLMKIKIADVTQGWTQESPVPFGLIFTPHTGEVIVEQPFNSGLPLARLDLANFGLAKFGGDYTSLASTNTAIVDSSKATFGALTSTPIAMYGSTPSGHIMAQPSLLSVDGTSFNIKWITKN